MDKKAKIRSVMVCAVLIGLAAGLFLFANAASPTPEKAVKKYVFFKGNFFQAKNLSVASTNIEDSKYGHQFIVSGYRSETGAEIVIKCLYVKGERDFEQSNII